MTLEELLEMSADKLEAMTDAQVTEFFTPMLQYTRPDKVIEVNKAKAVVNSVIEDKMARARKLAEQMGFDLGED